MGRNAHSCASPPLSGAYNALTFDLRCSVTRVTASASEPPPARVTELSFGSASSAARLCLVAPEAPARCRAAHLGIPESRGTARFFRRRAATSANCTSKTPRKNTPCWWNKESESTRQSNISFVTRASSNTDFSVFIFGFFAVSSTVSSAVSAEDGERAEFCSSTDTARSNRSAVPSACASKRNTLFFTATCSRVTAPTRDKETPSRSTANMSLETHARNALSRSSPGELKMVVASSSSVKILTHAGSDSTGRRR
mmetsp:Transcript_13284/g.55791  ORF Transcript_13284/g.55791 Transcript_13284/m.55791 type:complete len:255 (-) Transcript_13284:581-1345(-)